MKRAPAEPEASLSAAGHTAASVRDTALITIMVLLAIAALWFAQSIVVPIVLGILISYALDPVQRWLVTRGAPGTLAAALILTTLIAGCGAGAYALRGEATAVIAEIPGAAEQLKAAIQAYRQSGPTAVEQLEHAANEIKEVAAASSSPAAPGVTRVQIETPGLQVPDLLWQGWLGAVQVSGQVVLTVFVAFYLLAAGDRYKRKIVKIVGPTLSDKRRTVEILNEIDRQIESFLVARVVVSVIVAVATTLIFWSLGVWQAAIWGVAAGVLNIFPYIGPALVTAAAGVSGYVQFGAISTALLVAGAATAVASMEGFLITPWLMGRAGRVSPVAIFVGASFGGWLWGIAGLLLAIPLLMVAKAICDHIERLRFVGELLAD
jgi:predicted PurR-regulated permease PerM